MMQAIMALALAVGAAADVSEQSQGDNPTADVLVYGAALPGCVAAVAASRSGATRVVLTTPYLHVGGMTTGGLQHADPGNESTVAGITREFFDRVEARYAHAPPGPHHRQSEHTCRAGRCLEVTDGTGSPDSQCHKACPPLGPDEWLAVTFLSTLSDGNRTLTVTLPKGQASSFIKKSEKLAKDLPASSVKAVDQGQVLELSAPAVLVDQTYYRIQLKASPLARLVADTAQELSARRAASGLASAPGGLHPGAPPGRLAVREACGGRGAGGDACRSQRHDRARAGRACVRDQASRLTDNIGDDHRGGGANLFRKILDRRLLRGRSCYGCRCRDGLGTRGEHNLR